MFFFAYVMYECLVHYFCIAEALITYGISVSVSVFDRSIISEMGELGILGPTIKGESEPLVCPLFTLHASVQHNYTHTK